MNRTSLPYRKKTELFLLNQQGNIVVEDHGHYLMFPGGGIDAHEENNLTVSAYRELQEETGLQVVGKLQYFTDVKRDWFPEWANTPKRQERYEHFRGEHVYLFLGRVTTGTKINNIDDAWDSNLGLPFSEFRPLFHSLIKQDQKNMYAYRIAQTAAARAVELLYGSEI